MFVLVCSCTHRYELEITESEFNMAEYHKFCQSLSDEVSTIKVGTFIGHTHTHTCMNTPTLLAPPPSVAPAFRPACYLVARNLVVTVCVGS